MIFLDEATIHVRGGRGGRGCVAFRREKYVPRGGPSGGDGGQGGSVVLLADARLNTLYHLQFQSLYPAERGRHGEGSRRTGRSGADLEVRVPPGTVIDDAATGERLGELLADGERLVVAQGGSQGSCCGFGGLFATKFTGISTAMADEKLKEALEARADVIISGEQSCLLHLEGRIRRRRLPLRTVHLAEVLAASEATP